MTILLTLLVVALAATTTALFYLRRTLNRAHEALIEQQQEIAFLHTVLWDVANGEADVWVDDGEIKGSRRTVRKIQIH